MAHVEEVIQPFVQHHVAPPATIELRPTWRTSQFLENTMLVTLTNCNRLDEARIVIDTQSQIGIRYAPAAGIREPIGEF